MPLPKSNYLENEILKHIFRTGSFTKPTALWVAFLSALPTDDAGTGLTLVAGVSAVQRNPLDANWKDPATGTQGLVENIAELDFGTHSGASERYVGVLVADADPAGAHNKYYMMPLANGWFGAVTKASTDVLTAPGHGRTNGDRVFVRGGAIPAGLNGNTEYFVVGVSGDTFQLSLTSGGAAVDITADGACEVGVSQAQDVNNGNPVKISAGALDIIED
jgi:hypothetical protein